MDKSFNLRIHEQCIHRHWCPLSENVTGADSLVTALHQGWQIVDYRVERLYHGVSQGVVIYIFTLMSQGDCVVMSVIGNPYTERLAGQLKKVGLMGQMVDDSHSRTTGNESVYSSLTKTNAT